MLNSKLSKALEEKIRLNRTFDKNSTLISRSNTIEKSKIIGQEFELADRPIKVEGKSQTRTNGSHFKELR
jgi:flagellar hook assembly protein FlgD